MVVIFIKLLVSEWKNPDFSLKSVNCLFSKILSIALWLIVMWFTNDSNEQFQPFYEQLIFKIENLNISRINSSSNFACACSICSRLSTLNSCLACTYPHEHLATRFDGSDFYQLLKITCFSKFMRNNFLIFWGNKNSGKSRGSEFDLSKTGLF